MVVQMKGRVRTSINQKVFDKKRFKKNYTDPLKKFAAFVRRRAISSVRTDNSKAQRPSKPGKPPKSRDKQRRMKRIEFDAELASSRFLIGFVKLQGNTVPRLHEHGETTVKKVIVRPKRQPAYTKRQARAFRRKIKEGKFQHRFNTNYRIVKKGVTYPKRPTMKPALDKELVKLPPLYKDSIKLG